MLRELLERAALHRVSVTRTQLGTAVTVTVLHPSESEGRALVNGAFAEIERLEAIFSRYRADTPLARLNREGVVSGAPVELLHVVERALDYAQLSQGAFDVTVAPLLDLYVSRFATGATAPGRTGIGAVVDAELDAARALVGWRGLRVEDGTIALARPGMAVTLDGIAKGYVVDRGVDALRARGADRVIVQAGGDTSSASGEDDPWRVAIQDPHDPAGTLGVVVLNGSIASSGDYIQSFTPDRRLHHIIDPRTGRSPERSSGTSVIAPTALDADAASTAAFVLGPEAGIAFLDRLDGIEGLITTKEGGRFSSRNFEKTLA